MSSLVIAQTNNAGVHMSATVTDPNTTEIVVTFVSSTNDAAGSVDKSFPATSVAPGSFELTDSDLTTLFGASALSAMKNGNLSPAVSMSASRFDESGDEVGDALTTIDGLTDNKVSYLQFALPGAPVQQSVGLGDGRLTIEVNVESKNTLSDQIKLTVHKTSVGGLGEITNSTVAGTLIESVGDIHTFTFVAGNLANESVYEIFARFANNGPSGALQYGPKNAVAFVGEPNTLPGACSNLTSATILDTLENPDTVNAVTVGATWVKTDTDPDNRQPNDYKMIVSYNGLYTEVVQPAALDVSAGILVVLEPATIPHTWFTQGLTSIDVNVAIKQFYSNSSPVVGNTVTKTIYKMVMPTLSTAITVNVNNGDQTITPTTGSLGAGEHVLTADFAGDQTLDNSNELLISYDNIVAVGAGNTSVSFTFAVTDANGSDASYSVTVSKDLYAFKNPVPPNSPTLDIDGIESDPVIGFIKANSETNHGWKIDHYVVNVEYVGPDGGIATYGNPYDASFARADISSSIVATQNTGNAYIAGNYKAKITSVFSDNIPALYNDLYTLPAPMSSESSTARWWTRPTITGITVSGKTMTITGNNGGANYSTDAITSIGFVAGESNIEDDYAMSKITGSMPNAGSATDRLAADLFNFTTGLTHGADLKDLSGDYLDGLGFVDADNAPSALSIAVFNTTAISDLATTVQGALSTLQGDLQGLESTRDTALGNFNDASGNLADAISDLSNADGLVVEKEQVLTNIAEYTINGEIFNLTLELAAEKYTDISDVAVSFAITKEVLVVEGSALQTAFNDASGDLVFAESEVSRLSVAENTVANQNAYDDAVEIRDAAVVSFNDASGALVEAISAATNARAAATIAFGAAATAVSNLNTATQERDTAVTNAGTAATTVGTAATLKTQFEGEYNTAQEAVNDKNGEITAFTQQVATQDLDTAIANARILAQRAILKSN